MLKKLQHKCFPVKFAKFLRTRFFTEHLPWLILYYMNKKESDMWYRYLSYVIYVYCTDQKYRKDEICNIFLF